MRQPRRGFTLIEIMIVVAIVGILAALAVPNFIRYQAMSKQSEARTNLKIVFIGQKKRFADRDSYSSDASEVLYALERGNRYTYYLSSTCGAMESRTGAAASAGANYCGIGTDAYRFSGPGILPIPASAVMPGYVLNPGVTQVPGSHAGVWPDPIVAPGDQTWNAFAVGNIDNDTTHDAWEIGSLNAVVPATPAACLDGESYSSGGPMHVLNDVGC